MDAKATIIRDLNVAIEALKQHNLDLINIIGNRISSDSLIIKKDEFIIIGFLCKDISQEIRISKFWGQIGFEQSSKIGLTFLERLKSIVDGGFDIKLIWKEYNNYEIQIRKYLINNIEYEIYKEDFEFVTATRILLMEQLKSDKKFLMKQENNLIGGITYEISRVLNTYGYPPRELAFYLSMMVLNTYYRYFIYDYQYHNDVKERIEKWKELELYINSIEDLFNGDKSDDEFYEGFSKIIATLGARWREYVISFGDITPIVQQRGMQLPKEAKERIEEILIEGLEREARK